MSMLSGGAGLRKMIQPSFSLLLFIFTSNDLKEYGHSCMVKVGCPISNTIYIYNYIINESYFFDTIQKLGPSILSFCALFFSFFVELLASFFVLFLFLRFLPKSFTYL